MAWKTATIVSVKDNKSEYKHLIDFIEEQRYKKKIRKNDLPCSPQYYNKILSGESVPNFKILAQIAFKVGFTMVFIPNECVAT